MTYTIQIPGVTSSGNAIQRYKTAGPGTLDVFDFKNPATYPAGVTPTSSIPALTKLNDLPPASQSIPQNQAVIAGSTIIQSTGGGLNAGAGAWSNHSTVIQLPSTFILPALSSASGHYLIIMGYKPGSASAPGASDTIAGFATNTGSAANWLLYRNSGNANLFAAVGVAFGFFGALSVAPHRLGLEIIKTATTVTLNCYIDGVLTNQGSGAAQAAIPQPTPLITLPCLGGTDTGSNQFAASEYESIEIRNLALDTLTVQQIITNDYAAWAGRFA